MYELSKTFTFDAAHTLENHTGKCKRPHGHTYSLTVTLRAPKLQDSGPEKNMITDFQKIYDTARAMIDKYLDHLWLNDSLGTDSSTAEFIAKWAYDYLKPFFPELYSVKVGESSTSFATYFE